LLVAFRNPHPEAPTRPSTPKVLGAKERAPILYPSIVFTFRLAVQSTKEFGGASESVKTRVNFSSPLGIEGVVVIHLLCFMFL